MVAAWAVLVCDYDNLGGCKVRGVVVAPLASAAGIARCGKAICHQRGNVFFAFWQVDYFATLDCGQCFGEPVNYAPHASRFPKPAVRLRCVRSASLEVFRFKAADLKKQLAGFVPVVVARHDCRLAAVSFRRVGE